MVIEVFNLYKRFQTNSFHFELNIPKIQFEIGKITSIMGKNGSGKSVMLKILSGEFSNDSKDFYLTKNSLKLNSSFSGKIVRQKAEDNLSLELSVLENLIIHTEIHGFINKSFPKRKFKTQIINLLRRNSFPTSKIHQPVQELSGGQKQLLAFLIVSFNSSDMLFLDEFLSSTDFETTSLLLQKAKEYASVIPASVIIVSHDIEMALNNSQVIHILKDGILKETIKNSDPTWNKIHLEKLLRE